MAPRKPSTTKQIATALQTEDKVEQLKRIQGLVQSTQAPCVAVTVLFSNGTFSLSVVADGVMVRPDDIKYILQGGVDEVTKTVLQAQIAQQEPEEGTDKEESDDNDQTSMEIPT